MTLNNSVQTVVAACHIGPSSVVPFTGGMARLFADGFGGIASNEHAVMSQLQEVVDCQACSTIAACSADCIDDDDWSDQVDQSMFGVEKESTDLLLHVKTATGIDKLLLVEGKLGCLVNVYTGQNYYPTHTQLSEKYRWTMRRINGRYATCRTMVVLVSQDSIEQMRRRLKAYATAGQLPPTEFLCPHDFLAKLGVIHSFGTVVCGKSAIK